MDTDSRTYIMVPGAWHAGWAWRPVAQRLRAAGHRAHCLTLPGLGDGDDPEGRRLTEAVDHLVQETVRLVPGRVTFVGHSWAGYPMTGAAHQLGDKVSEIVYYTAIVPQRGVALADENPQYGALIRGLVNASPDGAVHVDLNFFRAMFMQNTPVEAQRMVAELLTPMPGGYLLDALDVPSASEAGIPARYILSAEDRGLARPGTEYAARLGLEPVMVPGPHEGMLTHPDQVADAILG